LSQFIIAFYELMSNKYSSTKFLLRNSIYFLRVKSIRNYGFFFLSKFRKKNSVENSGFAAKVHKTGKLILNSFKKILKEFRLTLDIK